MHFGIAWVNEGPAADPHGAVRLAEAAEAAGFESLWTVEHHVVPRGYESAYPYSSDGRMAGGVEDFDIPDPFVWLSYVAAHTERIRLATGVTVLPLRHPLALAKTAASLDAFSGGRVILGVGVGWLAEEFAALGVPFARRGARTDEYIAVLRGAWTGEITAHRGEFLSFDELYVRPMPVQRPIPIVVGGHSEAAARRAGRLGDGFFPAGVARERVLDLWAIARSAAEEAGRDPELLELTVGGRPDLDTAGWWQERGAHRLVSAVTGTGMVEAIGEQVVSVLG